MTITDLVYTAYSSLIRTKARSLLTMLGIVIGIMAVIVVLSIGDAAQRYILGQIESLGSDLIFIQNGTSEDANSPQEAFAKPVLTYDDAKLLKQQPWMKYVTPLVITNDDVNAKGERVGAQIQGTTPDEALLYDMDFAHGAFFEQEDVDSASKVAVLGHEVAMTLFGEDNPVGQFVKINNQNVRVVGVVVQSGTRAFVNLDKTVYMPTTSILQMYNQKFLTYAVVQPTISLDDARSRITELLRDNHNLREGDVTDFFMQTQQEAADSVSQITSILRIFLSSVAAISLLVGGIGIMNIMYVSVTERTREIGLRKALGAKDRDVLGQFLAEAVFLTGVGGVFGVLVGIGITYLAISIISQFQEGWTFSVSVQGILLGFGVSAFVGVLFGYAPAKQASRLRPIEALRKD